ncbi:MAG TPA: site-specific integrase, partial [Kiloniellales bacterium]|nr:site-specific integrase [Kiloniellales bacterium]
MAETAGVIGVPTTAELAAASADWQRWLRDEKRASPHTLDAYRRDLNRFLAFLAGHLGGAPALDDLAGLRAADFRAWLASLAAEGLARSSIARALSTVRGFYRWLARERRAENGALSTLRTPRQQRSVPRALRVDESLEVLDAV